MVFVISRLISKEVKLAVKKESRQPSIADSLTQPHHPSTSEL